jgi:Fungal specific transcription factor domain/Fungal Zn(2)-Cys(6) binuclear cluster domain
MLICEQCDEQRPACNNCLKHSIECTYSVSPVKSRLLAQSAATQANASSNSNIPSANLTSTAEHDRASHTTSPSVVSGNSDPLLILDPQRDGRFPSDLHLRDLELMHHYCISSYRTISQDDKFAEPFRNEVPKFAISHPFLMHGILALSALHLAYLNKNSGRASEYDELATGHQTLALALFRKELDNITPTNSGAMFVFSTIATTLAFASQQGTRVHSLSPIEDMLQIVNLCRGIAEILETSKPWMEGSDNWVSNLLDSRRSAKIHPLPADIDARLAAVFKLNADLTRTGFNIEEAVACEEAISEMSTSFQQTHSGYDPITVFRWPIVVKPILFSSIRDRRPMALVTLAHYCILLHRMDDRWWLEGWPRRLLQSIYSLLDPSWRDHIRWPLEALGLLP